MQAPQQIPAIADNRLQQRVTRAVSFRQPLASLIACGVVYWTDRDWPLPGPFRYRPIAIHASATWGPDEQRRATGPLTRELLQLLQLDDADQLPRGCIVGIGEVRTIRERRLKTPRGARPATTRLWQWAWSRRVDPPVAVRGQPGLFPFRFDHEDISHGSKAPGGRDAAE